MVMDDSIYDPLPYGCSTWRMCTLSRYEEIGSMRVMESLKQRLLMMPPIDFHISFLKFKHIFINFANLKIWKKWKFDILQKLIHILFYDFIKL